MRTRIWLLGVCWLSCFVVSDAPQAADRAANATREIVSEALQREAYGLISERNELLQSALQADPKAAHSHWYLGHVQNADGTWVASTKPADARADQLYREYRVVRDAKPVDAQGQKSLADWCARRGLKQQERAHLLRSLALNPQQAEIRQRLGLVKVGDQWYEPAAYERLQARAKALREATENWRPIFSRLAPQLSSPTAAKRQAAEAEILAVKDPLALPALQTIIGVRGEAEQELVVRVCQNLSDPLATELLACLAVEANSDAIRRQAAILLEPREEADYVPLLVDEMYSPVITKVEAARSGTGAIYLRRCFWREGADHHELFVSDASFTPTPAINLGAVQRVGLSATILANEDRARHAAQSAVTVSQLAVAEQNRLTHARNERIAAALTIATGEKHGARPDAWWQWWMETNEIVMPDGKGISAMHQTNRLMVAGVSAPTLPPPKPEPRPRVFISTGKRSCLVAGTPISTDQGFVAVERLAIGDLVLSRDIESGELAYKPVLQTTVRPQTQLLRITAGKDVFQATGGHLFWVSGQGWVRARELRPGQVLHAAGTPVTVLKVEDGIVSETHNLVVADFASYFVGEGQLLSHDNTPRQPTRFTVPGLESK